MSGNVIHDASGNSPGDRGALIGTIIGSIIGGVVGAFGGDSDSGNGNEM